MRCCAATPYEFTPCYASVLVQGTETLQALVQQVEGDAICPCVTGWCSACSRLALLTSAEAAFPCPSAHRAHLVALWRRLK